MRIRRYIGKDAQEAMLKVKMDLGSEAVILNTRKIRQRGFLKFMSKPMIEVLAAIDEYPGVKSNTTSYSSNDKNWNSNNEPVSKSREKEEKIILLENKVNSMENILQKIYEEVQRPGKNLDKELTNQKVSKVIELFQNNLENNEVDTKIIRQLLDMVEERCNSNISVNNTALILHNLISGMLGKPETIKLREDGKPTVVMFVGPTGVGKTTTLAKIAADYALNHQKDVGLITADTYRIAAVEQLRTYADILGMPLSVVYSLNEIKDIIEGYRDKDIIFIDTAGRSSRNKPHFNELKALVKEVGADEIFLVLSTTTSMNNCREIIDSYSFLGNYKLIFTKLDETPSLGIILNVKQYAGKKLSYVTNGQNVPDDIELADIDKITKNLIGSI
ncbi:flagellar biosynthesis protein FlhF [Acetivibrio saccincola]|uniref:Flagellar biosynthesis protein FlhF n=1 Tax=Acetivibrio saccincola TaxID=1677857 RepID=A0A2K9E8P6_9FIRM|nr:flagellar biosynthesis protein FlhF [Acetivibrio saccincola]AUG57956.1 Flagellar biosynthesis protein FlhF [Acetivibrio saccincola]HOA97541.1 flagellar biosynthesis protein FlhF [Acetivibrio saccincola]